MEQNVWLETLNTAPEQNSQSIVIKHHLNQVKTYQLDMLLKHPGYDGVREEEDNWIEYQFFVNTFSSHMFKGFSHIG